MARRKKSPQEDLEALHGRRVGRFPQQWDYVSQQQSRIDAERSQRLISGNYIDWHDLFSPSRR